MAMHEPRRRRHGWWTGILVRLITELVCALVWAVQLLALLLLPVTVPVAVGVAEFERGRARVCGTPVASERRVPWPDYVPARVRSAKAWVQDLPIAVISVLLGAVSLPVGLAGGAAGTAALAAPILWGLDLEMSIGPWVARSLGDVAGMVGAGAGILAATAFVLVGVSALRDQMVAALSGRREALLSAELTAVTSNRDVLVGSFEEERRRIERDLHDGAQQDLVSLSATLGLMDLLLADDGPDPPADPARMRELVHRAQDQNERSLRRLRETIHGIHPRELTDLGLFTALEHLAHRSPGSVKVMSSGADGEVPAPVASAVYFTAAEALTNAARHARAHQVDIEVRAQGRGVSLIVRDDGTGGAVFDTPGSGLRGLRERVRGVGGSLNLRSPRGEGTSIEVLVPEVARKGDVRCD